MGQILFTGVTVNELLQRIEQLIDSKIGVHPTKTEKTQSNYITRLEASKLLKVSLPTLHEWTKFGLLKAYKIGTRVLYKLTEIEESLNNVHQIKHKKGGFQHA